MKHDKTIIQPKNDFKIGKQVESIWEDKFDNIDKILFFKRGKVITKNDSVALFDKYQRIYSESSKP